MKKYKVIEYFGATVQWFDNAKEANKEAFNIQGVLIRVDENGNETILKDYTDF